MRRTEDRGVWGIVYYVSIKDGFRSVLWPCCFTLDDSCMLLCIVQLYELQVINQPACAV